MKDGCCGGGCCDSEVKEVKAEKKSAHNCCAAFNCPTLLIRVALGITLFWLGTLKLLNLTQFTQDIMTGFEAGVLPLWSVTAVVTVMPYIEVALGLLLFFGLFVPIVTHLTGLFFVILLFGLAASNQAGGIPFMFIYLFAVLLIMRSPYSKISLDRWFGCKNC